MKYKSTHNEFITKDNIEDRGFFNSRSCAVLATVIIKKEEKTYVLLGQRGTGTPDYQGYWNMPCGYLDWDESGTDAVYRELYEETGLDLEEFINHINANYEKCSAERRPGLSCVLRYDLEQPWYVNHFVTSNRQNVTLRFGVIVELLENDELPKLSNENSEPDEVSDLRWVDVNDIDDYKCAFGHKEVLKDYLTNE